jgi:FlaA1/EpsC-like NDP-sugar epimerase
MAKVPRVLLTWREHPARATRQDARYSDRRHRELKIEYLLAGPLAQQRPIVFWGAGIEGKPLLRALIARGCVPVAVVDIDPRKIGQRLHGVPVVAKTELAPLLAAHPGAVVLVAVGIPEARAELRADLQAAGLDEGRDAYLLR